MRRILVCLVFGLAFSHAGEAQTLYRCKPHDGGPTRFQSRPCEADAATASATGYRPERELTPAEQAARERAWRTRSQQQRTRRASGQGAAIPVQTGSRCESVKKDREAALERIGLRRTIDYLRYWDDRVREACR